ncbi:P63C domain-containing protein [Chloroflexota bacterium]
MADKPNRHAKALSKIGASKGGKARASVLTPEERTDIARKAVKTRWAKTKGISIEEVGQVSSPLDQVVESLNLKETSISPKPISLFQGELQIGDISFSCHVLDDGKRVLAQREVVGVLTGNKKGGLSRYLTATGLKDFISLEDITTKTIEFVIPGTQYKSSGYEATLLVEICDAYLKARDANVLSSRQLHLAKRAEIIIRACAKVGIIALIDEVTGYQKVREDTALQLKLQAFIADDMQDWARMFPSEFWIELARLENVRYSPRNRPIRWGKYVMAFVYDAVDKDVGKELRKLNPNPHYRMNHHQWLREFGRDKVRDHLNQVLGVMKMCKDMDDFNRHFGHIFKKEPLQLTFLDMVESYTKN